jgi:hypothetical protein
MNRASDRLPKADEKSDRHTMPRQEDPLNLYGHRIIPIATHQGSVRRWRCLDCDAEQTSADEYLETSCQTGPSHG